MSIKYCLLSLIIEMFQNKDVQNNEVSIRQINSNNVWIFFGNLDKIVKIEMMRVVKYDTLTHKKLLGNLYLLSI